MIPTSPLNHYTIALDSPFDDKIVTKSGVELYRDVTYSPENYAATNGTITAVPRFNYNKMGAKVGDQLFFSYQVIMDLEQRDRDTPVHKNMIFYKGKKHWLVNNELVYFFVRDDKIYMQNGFVLLNPVETPDIKSNLIIPDYLKKKKYVGRAQIIMSEDKSISNTNDIVYYDKRFVETYELWGKEYYLLDQKRILAKL